MKKLEWLCCLVLTLFLFVSALPPTICLAQPEDEEEEPVQARPNPMLQPNPMERSMLKPASSETLLLNDGRQLQPGTMGGRQVWFLVGPKGERSLADGSYLLQNGQQLTILRGAMNPAQMRNLPQMR